MPEASYGSLPFREQAEFFRRKVNLPTSGWTDIYAAEHDWAFVVAGANRDAIVADFREAVQKAIDGGSTLEDFRKDFDRIVATHGWDYNGGRDWRSRVIYDTNLSSSYAAGRLEQLQEAPYWEYVHQDWVEHPRPLHLSWNGLVLAANDPWALSHFPPNGWGCQCEFRGRWLSDLVRMGKSGPDEAPPTRLVERTIGQRSEGGPRTVFVPEGIDPGFEYAPGQARLRSAVPRQLPDDLEADLGAEVDLPRRPPPDPPPPPREAPGSTLLAAGTDRAAYVRAFLNTLGAPAEEAAIVRDVLGERVVVGPQMLMAEDGSFDVLSGDGGRMLPLLAEALRSPDEVWVRLHWAPGVQKAVVRRRYIARFTLPDEDEEVAAVFERGADGWSGQVRRAADLALDALRKGVRLFRRQVED